MSGSYDERTARVIGEITAMFAPMDFRPRLDTPERAAAFNAMLRDRLKPFVGQPITTETKIAVVKAICEVCTEFEDD